MKVNCLIIVNVKEKYHANVLPLSRQIKKTQISNLVFIDFRKKKVLNIMQQVYNDRKPYWWRIWCWTSLLKTECEVKVLPHALLSGKDLSSIKNQSEETNIKNQTNG